MNYAEKGVLRRFGNDLVGVIPWGTHLCQFYETKQDLIDLLVPYFAEGLRSNEFCMWVTSPPLGVDEAKDALKDAVPDLDQYIRNGQIEILSYADWYLLGGTFDSERVLQGWVEKEKAALKRGFEGLRLTGNTLWVDRDLWKSFVDYERAINSVIGDYRMIALCTYRLSNCSGMDVVDVIRNHVGTLIRQDDDWVLMEDATRRKAVNGALILSEQKYSTLFESMQDAFAYHKVLFDEAQRPVDYIFLEVNDAFERHTGLKRENILGKRVTQVLPELEKDPANWIEVYGRVAVTGEPLKFESYVEALDRWYWVSTCSPEKGYFFTIFEDVTELKKTEEAIRRLNERFEMAQHAAEVGVWDWNITTGHIEWSLEMFRLFGLDPQKDVASFESWKAVLHPEDQEKSSTKIDKVLKNHSFLNNEYRIIRPDGEICWINALGKGVYDEQNEPTRMMGICIDITERKMSEKALKEAEHDLKHAQAVSKTGSWRLDTQRNVLRWSDENHRIFGVPTGTPMTYETFLNSVHPDDKAYVDMKWKAGLRGEPYDVEHRIIVDGQVKWVREKAELEFDEDGTLLSAFGTTQDITDLVMLREKLEFYSKHLEDLVEEKSKQLKDAEKLITIGQTAGMVGHDIRNPLQSIDGSIYLAKEELQSLQCESHEKKELLEILDIIEDQIHYINHIVADLQDFARTPIPQLRATNIQNLISESISAVKVPKNVTVQTLFQEDLGNLVVDPTLIKRVTMNLIANAVQAMPNGGELTIKVSCNEKEAQICVEDTGVGIAEEHKPKIFTPLFTTKAKGQGFGLAVCKKLIDTHGGEISFESEEGKGSKFTIKLPFTRETD